MASVSSITQQAKSDARKTRPVVKLKTLINSQNRMAFMISGSEAIKNKQAVYFGTKLSNAQLQQMQKETNDIYIIEKSGTAGKISIRAHMGAFTTHDGIYFSPNL